MPDSMRSLSRAVALMQAFTSDRLQLSGAEMATIVGIPRSTAYRILEHLKEQRLLQQNPETGKFSIGPMLYAMGSLYLNSTDIPEAAKPVVKMMADLTGEAVNVIIREKQNVLVIMKEESRSAVRYSLHVGSSWPAYASAVGKALLSELSDSEIDFLYPEERLKPLTSKTIKNKTELKRELAEIRETGVSYNREGLLEGGEGIGAVIRNEKGEAIAGLSITIPVFRVDLLDHQRLSTLVRTGADLISYRLGYQGITNPVQYTEDIRSWWEASKAEVVS